MRKEYQEIHKFVFCFMFSYQMKPELCRLSFKVTQAQFVNLVSLRDRRMLSRRVKDAI